MFRPFGEYRPDISGFRTDYSQTATNVVPRGDGYGPFRAFEALTDALPDACRGFFVARDDDGSVHVFAGTETKLYKLNNTDFSWSDVSKSGGYSLPSGDNWQFAKFNRYVVAVMQNAVPQAYELGASSAFDNLSGSPPQARYVAVVNRILVLTGLLSYPNRIQWSDLNNITNWTTGQADAQDFPDGGVTRGVAGGEYGVVFQDTMIRRLTYVGPPLVFSIDRVEQDVGLAAPYSLVCSGNQLFFYSAMGFRRMIGGQPSEPIGKERIDREFRDDWDASAPRLLIGASDPTASRVYWAYKSLSGESGLFNKILCYDWALDRWTRTSVSGEYIGSFSQPSLTLENLDSIAPSIEDIPVSLDDFVSAITSRLSSINTAHTLGVHTGSALEATVETGEIAAENGRRIFVRGFRPITDASDCLGSIMSRDSLQADASQSSENSIDARGFIPARVDARYARLRLRIPAGSSWTFASGADVDIAQGGLR